MKSVEILRLFHYNVFIFDNLPVKKPQVHHHGHHHVYDHHTDFTNNKYQHVSAQRAQSSEQSSSSAASSSSSSSSSAEEFLPQRHEHHLREAPTNSHPDQHTKLFSPYQSETPYSQQQQLHHQQQYAQQRHLLTRERMRSSSEEEADSTEFRPIMSSQSDEYMSPNMRVETVVPPPPNQQQTRTPLYINLPDVPERESDEEKPITSGSGQNTRTYTHNIEIPVHFYRLQPLENGEGFEITSA